LEIANKIIKSELIDWRNLEWLQGKLKAIPENSLKKLKQSLINNSFVQPFNVWDNGKLWILDGHHRKLAMEQLEAEGYTIPDKLPANFVQCKDKKEASKMVLVYSSIYAKADEGSLKDFLDEAGLDFADVSLEIDLPELNLDTFGIEDIDEEKLDSVPEPQKEAISKLGDIFLIDGKHRVMCGDSTIKADVEALMAGKRADMVFTDPPYGVDIEGKFTGTILNDNLQGDEFESFLTACFANLKLFNGGNLYISYEIKNHTIFEKALRNSGFVFDEIIIWNKDSASFYSNNKYNRKFEPIFFIENGKELKCKPDVNVWDFPKSSSFASRDENNKRFNEVGNYLVAHPTTKPLGLIAKPLNNSTKENDLILDLFLGSGSTLIASQQTNRICYGMELDPIYIDVILRRYKNLYPDAKFECLNREFDFSGLFIEKE